MWHTVRDGWRRRVSRGAVVQQALVDTSCYTGSYFFISRSGFLHKLKDVNHDVTTVLDFDPADVAQVNFARGPTMEDVFPRQSTTAWLFVMVLAWSRPKYANSGWPD